MQLANFCHSFYITSCYFSVIIAPVQEGKSVPTFFYLFIFVPPLFFFFGLFRVTPTAYGGSQARGPTGATAMPDP